MKTSPNLDNIMKKSIKNNNLKLYVWEDILSDWTPGIGFALAKSANHARELISPGWLNRKKDNKLMGQLDQELLQKPQIFNKPKGFSMSGGG